MLVMKLNNAVIRSKREQLGMTQQQAAEVAGIGGRQHWNRIETGAHAVVDVDTLYKISRLLKCRMEDLLVK